MWGGSTCRERTAATEQVLDTPRSKTRMKFLVHPLGAAQLHTAQNELPVDRALGTVSLEGGSADNPKDNQTSLGDASAFKPRFRAASQTNHPGPWRDRLIFWLNLQTRNPLRGRPSLFPSGSSAPSPGDVSAPLSSLEGECSPVARH
ncbi:UNVERIFIED_CONTAM: hypothetical protein K2H54_010373 [Gekko kuhli]